jgi:hypothetical protein
MTQLITLEFTLQPKTEANPENPTYSLDVYTATSPLGVYSLMSIYLLNNEGNAIVDPDFYVVNPQNQVIAAKVLFDNAKEIAQADFSARVNQCIATVPEEDTATPAAADTPTDTPAAADTPTDTPAAAPVEAELVSE